MLRFRKVTDAHGIHHATACNTTTLDISDVISVPAPVFLCPLYLFFPPALDLIPLQQFLSLL